jgi:hypothetical protein
MKRRSALLALLAAPVAAGAQTTPSSGQVLFTSESRYIGQAECAADAGMSLSWLVALESGQTYPVLDPLYAIYTSNDPDCADTNTTTGDITEPVQTEIPGGATLRVEAYPGTTGDPAPAVSRFLGPLGLDCASADTKVYACVELTAQDDTTLRGRAKGYFDLQLAAPNPPTDVSVRPSEEALAVSWTASAGSPSVKDYRASATNVDEPLDVHYSGWVGGTSTRIEGLSNLHAYDVAVVARSFGDNLSDEADAPGPVQPVAIDDFWEHYTGAGGQEEGGCSTGGGAGLLALLGALALRGAGRRRP